METGPTVSTGPSAPGGTGSDWVAVYEDTGLIRSLMGLFRRTLLARRVVRELGRAFPRGSTVAELGCGTTESSSLVSALGLKAIYVDRSFELLRRSSDVPRRLCADFFFLPLRDECLDGIWNVGVMEHFEARQLVEALRSYARATRRGGRLVLFWPWEWAPYQLFLRSLECLLRLVGRPKQWYPDEVSRYRSRRQIEAWLRGAGLEPVACRFSPTDLFSFAVVVARKP